MSKEGRSDESSEDMSSLIVSRVPYMTSSGHIRYTNKEGLKELPIDFGSWIAIFDQESGKVRLWVT